FCEQWIFDRLNDQREDVEHRVGRLVLAGQDVEQSLALRFVGALVEDRLEDALAVMDRSREIKGRGDRQVVEADILAMTPVDLEGDRTGAGAVGWVGHRFARAAVIATAIFDVSALDLPILARHHLFPAQVLFTHDALVASSCWCGGADSNPYSSCGSCP